MNAAFGLRFAPDFFFAAGRLAAAFLTLRAGDFLAAGFFAAFLPFLAAIDESSNLMMSLGSSPSRPTARQREDAEGKTRCQHFSLGRTRFFPLTWPARNTRFQSSRARSTSSGSTASHGSRGDGAGSWLAR